MAQQNSKPAFSSRLSGPDEWLQSETLGRERLRVLLEQWIKRNGWSLAVVSRLAELSLLAKSKTPVPDWLAGMRLQPGDWVNHRGHAWEAVGTPVTEPTEGAPGWIDHGLTSRLHASGLNLYLRKRKASLTITFLLEMGRLNEWVADVKAGRATAPADQRLNDLVKDAQVITDEDGPLGPEEFLSIAGDRLQPPPWPEQATSLASEGFVPARQLRAAAAAASLDIIDDWDRIADLFPSQDEGRLKRLQQVLQGLAQWAPDQEEDERVACLVLLERLQQLAGQVPQKDGIQQVPASVEIPAETQQISGSAD